jgi:serine/threonine protein kinase
MKEHMHQLTDWNQEDKYDKTVREFLPVLDAVGCLHTSGIIHRDIKPSNIMFQDGCVLKLMDLGIAKSKKFFDAHMKGFIGTVPFAAPEQHVDDNSEADIDERADVYAIGVTLAYLLVDHFPLTQSDKMPVKLKNIIRKATEHDADYRYPTTNEMKYALEDYVNSRECGNKSNLMYLLGIPLLILLAILIFKILIH